MAAVFAGLTCTALQLELFAIGLKTKLGHPVSWFISFECNDNVFVVSICDCCRSEVTEGMDEEQEIWKDNSNTNIPSECHIV